MRSFIKDFKTWDLTNQILFFVILPVAIPFSALIAVCAFAIVVPAGLFTIAVNGIIESFQRVN